MSSIGEESSPGPMLVVAAYGSRTRRTRRTLKLHHTHRLLPRLLVLHIDLCSWFRDVLEQSHLHNRHGRILNRHDRTPTIPTEIPIKWFPTVGLGVMPHLHLAVDLHVGRRDDEYDAACCAGVFAAVHAATSHCAGTLGGLVCDGDGDFAAVAFAGERHGDGDSDGVSNVDVRDSRLGVVALIVTYSN